MWAFPLRAVGREAAGFRRVTCGCCCCQTAYIAPVPALSSLFAGLVRSPHGHHRCRHRLPRSEHREEVIAAFEAAEEKVHAEEDGCELYALHEGPDGRLVMIEEYASEEAVAVHRAADGLAGLRAALDGKLSAPMDVQVLTPDPAGSAAKGAL